MAKGGMSTAEHFHIGIIGRVNICDEWENKLMARTISQRFGILRIIRGRSLRQVRYMGNNSAAIELEFGDIENWRTDSEIKNYLVSRSVADEYRDSERSGDCDVSEKLAETNLIRTNWWG